MSLLDADDGPCARYGARPVICAQRSWPVTVTADGQDSSSPAQPRSPSSTIHSSRLPTPPPPRRPPAASDGTAYAPSASLAVLTFSPADPSSPELDYYHFSALSPPSPFSPGKAAMLARPRAPTPSKVQVPQDDWNSDYDPSSPGVSPSTAYVVASSPPTMLSPPPVINSQSLSALGYTAFGSSNNDEEGALSDSGYSHSSQRSTSVTALPDPNQFPDPYPYRRPSRWHIGTTTPALSSADSSSASTRSSAYTGSAKSGDYGHVHVALGDDESGRGVGVGITTDDVVQLLSKESGATTTTQGRTPVDQTRWSDFYQNGIRSRSSSLANSKSEPVQEKGMPPLRGSPSFDLGWQRPDERDEVGLGSGEETDDDPSFDDDGDEEEEEVEEEPTSAAIIAEEGRGVIVRGDDTPVVRLQVAPGASRQHV